MQIVLIRHAEPSIDGNSLTKKGYREAALLAKRMQMLPIDQVYYSPLGRARTTAEIILDRLACESRELAWLAEFRGTVECPGFSRQPWSLPAQYWTGQSRLFEYDGWLSHPLMAQGNIPEEYARVTACFDSLLMEYGYNRNGLTYKCSGDVPITIVLVCHFGLIMILLSHLYRIAPPLLWHGFFAAPSSVTTLLTEQQARGEVLFRCTQLGDTSHLFAGGEADSQYGLYAGT